MWDGPQILNERLNASRATGIHVPINLPPVLVFSGADFLHEPGETRLLEPDQSE